jgi:NDP-sugar pyrophosphorylase family protein
LDNPNCYIDFSDFQTEADKRFLAAKGSVPIGIGRNSHIKRAIVDKNARIGENVKVIILSNYIHLHFLFYFLTRVSMKLDHTFWKSNIWFKFFR